MHSKSIISLLQLPRSPRLRGSTRLDHGRNHPGWGKSIAIRRFMVRHNKHVAQWSENVEGRVLQLQCCSPSQRVRNTFQISGAHVMALCRTKSFPGSDQSKSSKPWYDVPSGTLNPTKVPLTMSRKRGIEYEATLRVHMKADIAGLTMRLMKHRTDSRNRDLLSEQSSNHPRCCSRAQFQPLDWPRLTSLSRLRFLELLRLAGLRAAQTV